MKKKILWFTLTFLIAGNIAFGSGLIPFLKDNAVLYIFINLKKINKDSSSFLLSGLPSLYSNKLNEAGEIYTSIEQVLKNNNINGSINNIFMSIKSTSERTMFSEKQIFESAVIFQLNKMMDLKNLRKIITKILQSKGLSGFQIEPPVEKQNSIVIKNPNGSRFELISFNEGRIIAGGSPDFIKKISNTEKKEAKLIKFEKNNDVFIEYIIPEEVKQELLNYAEKLKTDKNAIPIELSFLAGLKYIRTFINFAEDIIYFKTKLYLKNESSLNKAKELTDQILPLIKFELLTISKGNPLTIVDSMKVTIDNKNKILNLNLNISSNDIKELTSTKKKE